MNLDNYLQSVCIDLNRNPPLDRFPFTVPAIARLGNLKFHERCTFLIGENGRGKSTVMEALALEFGMQAEGGGKNFRFRTKDTHSDLFKYISVAKGVHRPNDLFFLRAETFYNVATEVDRVGAQESFEMALDIDPAQGLARAASRSSHDRLEAAGLGFAQVAEEAGQAFPDMLLEIGPRGGRAAHFVMDEALQARLLLDPHVAIASDGSPGGSHPRGAGTFAKWIQEFAVRDGHVSLEEAVRKATGLPASILRLPDRGVLREGAVADAVLFDPSRVRAHAGYVNPTAQAEGFDLVLLNGTPAFEDGERVAEAGVMAPLPVTSTSPILPWSCYAVTA